jgi:hypothetical protein
LADKCSVGGKNRIGVHGKQEAGFCGIHSSEGVCRDSLIQTGGQVHGDAPVFSSGWGHGAQLSFDEAVPAAARRQPMQILRGDRLGCGIFGGHGECLVLEKDRWGHADLMRMMLCPFVT